MLATYLMREEKMVEKIVIMKVNLVTKSYRNVYDSKVECLTSHISEQPSSLISRICLNLFYTI